MAKGSVRKKGKKWYYRFYIEDESGNRVQKEFPGTESIFFLPGTGTGCSHTVSFNALTGLSCYGKNVQYFKFFMILFMHTCYL